MFGVDITTGPLNPYNWFGIIFVYTLYLVPLIYLPVAASLRNLGHRFRRGCCDAGAHGTLRCRRSCDQAVSEQELVVGTIFAFCIPFHQFLATYQDRSSHGSHCAIDEYFSGADFRGLDAWNADDCTDHLGFMVARTSCWQMLFRYNRWSWHAFNSDCTGRWKWPSRIAMLSYFLVTTILPFIAIVLLSMQPFWSSVIHWTNLNLNNYNDVLGGLSALGKGARDSLLNSLSLASIGATGGFDCNFVNNYSVHASALE